MQRVSLICGCGCGSLLQNMQSYMRNYSTSYVLIYGIAWVGGRTELLKLGGTQVSAISSKDSSVMSLCHRAVPGRECLVLCKYI